MNGRRRFLVGTVLSIQNGSFIYPACQNCCSRLILTSCRYECRKCGSSYKDATHRYKLCVKVSEEHRLHVITIFGKCLEKIFGASADSLHSHLQVSSQLSGNLEHDKAQELLFQAAERCLIGRSFIFAVKIPENLDSNSLSHSDLHRNIIACQIILHNEDPISCTVLSFFSRLVASALSNNSIHTKADVSTDPTNCDPSDLGFSESSSSFHQSWNHYADYWQQSLGLVTSPVSNTLAESQYCNYRQDECSRAEQILYPDAETPENSTLCVRSKVNSTDRTTHFSNLISISRVTYPSPKRIHTNTRSPPSSSQFSSFSSKSKMAPGQESYLQNICKSGSFQSQSCSALTMQLPSQIDEIHQAKEEIWEDFPFSESLSEFIAKIEDEEGVRPTEITTITILEEKLLNGKPCRRSCDLMNVPDAESDQNCRNMKGASHCSFNKCSDIESSRCVRMDDSGLLDQTFPSADLSTFQESIGKSNHFDEISRALTQDRQSPAYPKMLSIGTYVDDGLATCSFIEDLDKFGMSLEKEIFNCRDNAVVEDVDLKKVTSEVKSTMNGDDYNASADLFEAGYNPEDDGTSQSQHIGSSIGSQGRLSFFITEPSCTDVLPYQHRDSRKSVSPFSENYETWSNFTTEDFRPYLQSTPVLRRLSGTSRLAVDRCRFNMPSNSKSSTISIKTKSSSTIRHILLKNMRRRKSTMFYRLSENCLVLTPTLSPERSTALIPRNRTVWAHKPGTRGTVLENKDNYDNQTQGPNEDLTCIVKRTDGRDTGRESIKHSGDTLDNMENMSPVNQSLQEGEDQLCSVQEPLLPSDWSPELFSGKSQISQTSDCLQRRLF